MHFAWIAFLAIGATAVDAQTRPARLALPLVPGHYSTNTGSGNLATVDGGRSYALVFGDGSVVYGTISTDPETREIRWSGLWARRPAGVSAKDFATRCPAERPARNVRDPILGFASPYWGRFSVVVALGGRQFSGYSVTCDQKIPTAGLPANQIIRGKWVGPSR